MATNYQWFVGIDVDYDTYYACRNGSDCCDNDYCRCGEITDKSLKIDFYEFTAGLAKHHKIKDDIGTYGINRIATLFKMYDPTNWDVEVCGGYYGQEIDGVYFNNDKVEAEIYKFKQLEGSDRIEFLLNLEYAKVPTKYRNKTWTPAKVSPEEVLIGNNVHLKRSHGCEYYEDYPSFICLALKTPKGYEIVDGYHRFAANLDKEKILILSGE